MCTVVCRWDPAAVYPVKMLALRDELRSRAFDEPGTWWPDQPGVIGGRDRTAGGSWCVSDVASGVTSVVLNWPDQSVAQPGAPSRGVLPLRGVRDGDGWADGLELSGMAGFHLVLATAQALTWWSFDGTELIRHDLAPGTHMFTPRGEATSLDPRLTSDGGAGGTPLGEDDSALLDEAWTPWLAVIADSTPSLDAGSMLVRQPHPDPDVSDVFETVFGQFIAARPGRLRLDFVSYPLDSSDWTTQVIGAVGKA